MGLHLVMPCLAKSSIPRCVLSGAFDGAACFCAACASRIEADKRAREESGGDNGKKEEDGEDGASVVRGSDHFLLVCS